MTNPVLVSNDTPFAGFTVDSMCERLLGTRGMTMDAATMRVEAIPSEQTDAYNRIRRAMGLCYAKFPTVFSIQEHSFTWVSGDHSVALPNNCRTPLYVLFGGVNVRAMKREDYLRIVKNDQAGGGVEVTGDHPLYYRITGVTANGMSPPNYRTVMQVFPTPSGAQAAGTCIIGYNARAGALSNTTFEIPLYDIMQEWLLQQARLLWAHDESDMITKGDARELMAEYELQIHEIMDGTLETPDRIRWEYPTLPTHTRDS